jgi:phosphatidylethanolamine/phosphatidyl-N-methylethanolamine N-methyltransferase
MSDTTLEDNLRFFRALLARPRSVGAFAPSGPHLAKAMAAQIRADLIQKGGPVLELGPGSGSLTQGILERVPASQLTCIEYDHDLCQLLKTRFHGVNVIHGDAFNLEHTLGHSEPYAAIISGLPLLNFPMPDRQRLLAAATARLMPGGVFAQFSYGLKPSVPAPPGFQISRAAMVWANVPPARVWAYRKA